MANGECGCGEDPPRMGIGIVIRDHSGSFVAACCHKIDRITDVEMAEALAVRYAVYFAKEHNLHQVLVASDCLNLIKKIQSPVMYRSHVQKIVCRATKYTVQKIPRLNKLLWSLYVALRNSRSRCNTSNPRHPHATRQQ